MNIIRTGPDSTRRERRDGGKLTMCNLLHVDCRRHRRRWSSSIPKILIDDGNVEQYRAKSSIHYSYSAFDK